MADFSEDKVEVKPSIIMKVDAPPEDNNVITSQGTSMNNPDQSDATTKTPIKPVLESPRLNNKVLNFPKLNAAVVLRPSQLGSKIENKTKNTTKNPFALNPSRFDKVFEKTSTTAATTSSSAASATSSTSASSSSKNGTSHDATKPDESCNSNSMATNLVDSTTTETNSVSSPKFVPLVVTTETPKSSSSGVSSSSIASTSNFVFGQNLHERVVSESENDVSTTHDMNSVASSSCSNANGTSELLFSSAAKKTANTQEPNKEVKSLTESAREYEESRANKRKYEEVQVVTGEEDEKNVLQINCKLFAFDKVTSNWQERGRGTLRLNDKEIAGDNLDKYNQSRLVFRTAGSLRVVLNTKIWAEMTIDKAGLKSLRLTAMDASGQIKVFLIMASTEEINQLQRLLETRVKSEIERQKQLKKFTNEPEVKKQAIENNENNGQ